MPPIFLGGLLFIGKSKIRRLRASVSDFSLKEVKLYDRNITPLKTQISGLLGDILKSKKFFKKY